MEINKAHWSMEDDHIRLSMPINKVDKERRMVYGFATLDNIDKQGDVVPSDASIKAFERFRGNLREMHQPVAVGKVVSFKEDRYFDEDSKKFYNGVYVSAYVSKGAQNTWEKVLDGTLTGFSIGGEINESEDVYDEEMSKSYRVIKDYSLSELSLVDNPANQFANVISIEKVDGSDTLDGYLSKASIENVFWCKNDDIIRMSPDSNSSCPQCNKDMGNIGFVESNDIDKASVVKSMIKSIKKSEILKEIEEGDYVKFDGSYGRVIQIIFKGGARLSSEEVAVMAKSDDPVVIIKSYSQNQGIIVPTNRRVIKNISSLEKVNAISKSEVKEVSKMDSDIIVVDEIEKGEFYADSNDDSQVNPDPTELPVVEHDATVATTEKAVEIEIESENEEDEGEEEDKDKEEEMGDDMKSAPAVKAEEPEVTKADEMAEVAKSVESLVSTISTLAETVKALDAKIEGINKAVAGVSSEVESVKDNFGKRVDAVEKDTAFRKSADLGEILQEEPVIMEKATSSWGGRFLTNADLFK